MDSGPTNTYIMVEPESFVLRIIAHMRKRMFARFLQQSGIAPQETLIDVGVSGEQRYESYNYVEAWYPHKNKITAVGIEDASFLEQRYPGLTFKQANGLNLPFADNSFDIAHSSAVIEHVGSLENQKQFLSELLRVARRGIFITTPNRWYPVEFHTVLPLLHWLPKPWFRALLNATRYDFFAQEANLNLLGKTDLAGLVPAGYRYTISTVQLLGWPSNLLLWIEKEKK